MSRRLDFLQSQGADRTNVYAKRATDALLRPRQPRHGAVHLQTFGRTDIDARRAADAPRLVDDGRFQPTKRWADNTLGWSCRHVDARMRQEAREKLRFHSITKIRKYKRQKREPKGAGHSITRRSTSPRLPYVNKRTKGKRRIPPKPISHPKPSLFPFVRLLGRREEKKTRQRSGLVLAVRRLPHGQPVIFPERAESLSSHEFKVYRFRPGSDMDFTVSNWRDASTASRTGRSPGRGCRWSSRWDNS